MASSGVVRHGSPGHGGQGRGAQRRSRSQWAGPAGEDGCSMPISLPFLSTAGNHWLGLLPVTEGRKAGDGPGEAPEEGGHQHDRKATFSIHADSLGIFRCITPSRPAGPLQVPSSRLTGAGSPPCLPGPLATSHFSDQLCDVRDQSSDSFSKYLP